MRLRERKMDIKEDGYEVRGENDPGLNSCLMPNSRYSQINRCLNTLTATASYVTRPSAQQPALLPTSGSISSRLTSRAEELKEENYGVHS